MEMNVISVPMHQPANTQRADGSRTCGDNAEGEATPLVKVLTGDCQRRRIDQASTQA